ncbi:MAG TPA: PQQ-binding-like beta-propeller repeat protein, partial [Rhodanobacteraceae bacterium]|nr:PQQ-binding-like beta-propeller repeat protein [Rhodanobacteraceae bacterium]
SRPVRDLALYDYDGDGTDDFVVVTDAALSDTHGVELFVFSGVDGSELWASDIFDDGASAQRVLVVPGTGGDAGFVAVDNTRLHAFDAATGQATWTLAATNDGAVYIPIGAAGPEIAVMSEDGALSFYDAATRAYLRGFPFDAPTCDVVALGGDVRTLLVASGDALIAFNGKSGEARATAGDLGACVASNTRIATRDEPGSSHAIALGTSSVLVRERLGAPDAIFADSFDPH